MGSKSVLLRTLVVASSAKMAGFGAPSSVPKWRAIQNKKANPYTIEIACDFAR
jgi:site-specific DNA recombinase